MSMTLSGSHNFGERHTHLTVSYTDVFMGVYYKAAYSFVCTCTYTCITSQVPLFHFSSNVSYDTCTCILAASLQHITQHIHTCTCMYLLFYFQLHTSI